MTAALPPPTDDPAWPVRLTSGQLADLRARLEVAATAAEGLQKIHAGYAFEANAYRRVLETLRHL